MRYKSAIIGLCVLGAAVSVAGCGPAATKQSIPPTTSSNAPYQTQGVTHSGNKVTVAMKLDSFKLIPDKVVVRKGDVVTFNATNIATNVPHDVVIPDFGPKAKTRDLASGESESFTFTADKTGTFKMLCDIPGHEQAGMVGQFIVVQ